MAQPEDARAIVKAAMVEIEDNPVGLWPLQEDSCE